NSRNPTIAIFCETFARPTPDFESVYNLLILNNLFARREHAFDQENHCGCRRIVPDSQRRSEAFGLPRSGRGTPRGHGLAFRHMGSPCGSGMEPWRGENVGATHREIVKYEQ